MMLERRRSDDSRRDDRRAHRRPSPGLTTGRSPVVVPLLALALAGCRAEAGASPSLASARSAEPVSPARHEAAPTANVDSVNISARSPVAPQGCPATMADIPGGPFWVGLPAAAGSVEESPRFRTVVAPFCLDRTEITVGDYAECVAAGACEPAHREARACNARGEDGALARHPINCVDWNQATRFCAWRGARLPSEVEWEFAARGGEEYRTYSWGNDRPRDQVCWKRGHSCEVGRYAAGAFGLYDMTGNVWEWTSTAFGRYPWPPLHGAQRVYRGGSWSRRFAKWMRTGLRNRYPPKKWGSHLGMRCALTLETTHCAHGRTEDGTTCRFAVSEVECEGRKRWNGVRCARPGGPECPAGRHRVSGHGCVPLQEPTGRLPAVTAGTVARSRSPQLDADCRKHYPGRPRAFRYVGGTHAARNRASGEMGCTNRDVGVGWNSVCCP